MLHIGDGEEKKNMDWVRVKLIKIEIHDDLDLIINPGWWKKR